VAALRQLRKNSSEQDGTLFHAHGMEVAAKLTPEVVGLLRVEDQDIQVTI
jgi:hypothetical protein